jgi:CRP-like cAMP-binding protein
MSTDALQRVSLCRGLDADAARQLLAVARLGEGDVFGEMALISPKRRSRCRAARALPG